MKSQLSNWRALVCGFGCITISIACGGENTTSPQPGPDTLELTVPMVDATQILRVGAFGAPLGVGRFTPVWSLYTANAEATVVAVTTGQVVNVLTNAGAAGDFEMHTRRGSSRYLVIYDHVRDLRVALGASVSAGTALGRVMTWTGGLGWTELQINDTGGASGTLARCPLQFGNASFNALHVAAFARTPGAAGNICQLETVVP